MEQQQSLKKDGLLTVALSGELDHHNAAALRTRIDALLQDRSIRELVFDMRAVTFMDSSGIGIILGRYRTMSERGGGVSIQNANKYVERMLKMAGLSSLLKKQAR